MAGSHHLNQSWPNLLTRIFVSRSRWVDTHNYIPRLWWLSKVDVVKQIFLEMMLFHSTTILSWEDTWWHGLHLTLYTMRGRVIGHKAPISHAWIMLFSTWYSRCNNATCLIIEPSYNCYIISALSSMSSMIKFASLVICWYLLFYH